MIRRQSLENSKTEKPPATISEFRKLATDVRFMSIPEVAERRKCTDIAFLIVHIIYTLLVIAMVVAVAINGDFSRFTNGYDYCGNICGKTNKKIAGVSCSGQDMTSKGYLMIPREKPPDYDHEVTSRNPLTTFLTKNPDYNFYSDLALDDDDDLEESTEAVVTTNPPARPKKDDTFFRWTCVKECKSPYQLMFINRCVHPEQVNKQFWERVNDNIIAYVGLIIALILMSFLMSLLFLIGLRYFPKCTAYVTFVLFYISNIFLIVLFILLQQYVAIIFPVISLLLFTIIIACMWRRLNLVCALLQETAILLFRSPVLFLQPLLTIICKLLLWLATFAILIQFSTVGKLVKDNPTTTHLVYYKHFDIGGLGIAALILWLIMQLWFSEFMDGCETIIVAYTVEAHYFAPREESPRNPVCTGYYVLCRFHLGTVSAGSLLITIITAIRITLEALMNQSEDANFCITILKMCASCCLRCIEEIIRYLTQKAWIMTAMHGKPLWSSGVRGFRLLWTNYLDTFSLSCFVDAMFVGIGFAAIVMPMVIGYFVVQDLDKDSLLFILLITLLFIVVVTICLLGTMTLALDVVFLCYCEDKLLNDGVRYPFAMSTKLAMAMQAGLDYDRARREEGKGGCC